MSTAVLLAGCSGYGRRHLDELLAWQAGGRVRLAALVDFAFDDDIRRAVGDGPVLATSVEEALAATPVDLAVVATPPHTHFTIADLLMRRKVALYMEKPPVPLLRQLDDLIALDAGPRVEVGFQLARTAIEAIEPVLAAGTIGDVRRITAHGCLRRPDSYYARSRWSGRWFTDGQAVLDGALFTPLAHVVHTALTLAKRVDSTWAPATVEAELYAVRSIAGDDTGVLRVRSVSGPEVVAAGTTAADIVAEPSVTIHGTAGRLTIRQADASGVVESAGRRRELPPRRPAPPLLDAVTDPTGPADPLIDLAATRPFVTVVNAAVELAGTPVDISRLQRVEHVTRTLPGINGLIARVVGTGRLFAELGVPWAAAMGSLDVRGYRGLSHPELAA
jgi:predicted dehydrogenase